MDPRTLAFTRINIAWLKGAEPDRRVATIWRWARSVAELEHRGRPRELCEPDAWDMLGPRPKTAAWFAPEHATRLRHLGHNSTPRSAEPGTTQSAIPRSLQSSNRNRLPSICCSLLKSVCGPGRMARTAPALSRTGRHTHFFGEKGLHGNPRSAHHCNTALPQLPASTGCDFNYTFRRGTKNWRP